jgi:crotonobetainyl-CoA:carnitine CoA-transferase CaiB-like acyl-CoA transferase
MKLARDPIRHASAPPTLGQHTDEVLRAVLGLADAEIQRLRAERVI